MKNKLIKFLSLITIISSVVSLSCVNVSAKNNNEITNLTSEVVVDNSLGLFTASDNSAVSFEKNAARLDYPFVKNADFANRTLQIPLLF